MSRAAKSGAVLAGYALALVARLAAVAVYDRGFTLADDQAMGGMIAGGEMMFGVAVFLAVALAPTGLGLWFLRGSRTFWSAFSAAVLAFAVAGLGATLAFFATRGTAARTSWFALVELFGHAQMLGAPLWAGGFALFALLAPAANLRRRLLVATAIEIAIGGLALAHFLVPMLSR